MCIFLTYFNADRKCFIKFIPIFMKLKIPSDKFQHFFINEKAMNKS